MRNVLILMAKKPVKDASIDFLQVEIDKLINNVNDCQMFLQVINSKHFELKVFINEAITESVIVKSANKYYLGSKDGDMLGNTVNDIVETLLDKKNADIYNSIKLRLENIK